MATITIDDSSDEASREEEEVSPKRIKKRLGKKKLEQQKRKAEALAEATKLKKARKQKQEEKAKAKKRASANDSAAGSSTHDINDPVKGFCDVCQMDESYRKDLMKLWRCRDCRVHVHDKCYGASVKKLNKPNPKFRCLACQAVGHSFKTREREAFSGDYLEIKQKKRATECCLCDVDDGIHAMHPIYDVHGNRGRQILLPEDEDKGKPRRLAWAHSLCAQMVCQSSDCTGAIYGCAPDGFCGEESDDELLSDSDSVNSDLEREGDPTAIHHYVWWGYLQKLKNKRYDAWSKSIVRLKEGVRCNICGENDKKTVKLPGGQKVYQSLRIALQCCANNKDEAKRFTGYHTDKEDGPCCVAVHVGCVVWGRNDDGEYARARACWFSPGFEKEEKERGKQLPKMTSEIYCQRHALDIFCQPTTLDVSDMTDRLPGPFIPISGPAKERFKQTANGKNARRLRIHDESSDDENSGDRGIRELPTFPDAPPPARAPRAASRPRAVAREPKPGSSARSESQSRAASRPRALVHAPPPAPLERSESQSRPKKRPSNSKKASKAPAAPVVMRNVSLHGETKKKRATELQKAGEAKSIHTKKHGRLASKRNSSSLSQGLAASAQELQHSQLDMVQEVLEDLVAKRKEMEQKGEAFGKEERVKLKIKAFNKFNSRLTKEQFDEVWKQAKVAHKDGILDVRPRVQMQEESTEGDDQEEDVVMMDDDVGAQSTPEPDHQSDPGDRSQQDGPQSAPEPDHQADTGDGSQQDEPGTSSPSDPHTELVEKMVRDILEVVEGLDKNDPQLVHKTLKERKSYWKKASKASGLSRTEYRVVFDKATSKVSESCSWLCITGTSSDNNNTQQPGKDQAKDVPMEETPADEGNNQEDEPVNEDPGSDKLAASPPLEPQKSASDSERREQESHQASTQEAESTHHRSLNESNDSAPNAVRFWTQKPKATGKPPSRWSHLHYGPHYRKEGFVFGDWDTYEEIDALSDREEPAV